MIDLMQVYESSFTQNERKKISFQVFCERVKTCMQSNPEKSEQDASAEACSILKKQIVPVIKICDIREYINQVVVICARLVHVSDIITRNEKSRIVFVIYDGVQCTTVYMWDDLEVAKASWTLGQTARVKIFINGRKKNCYCHFRDIEFTDLPIACDYNDIESLFQTRKPVNFSSSYKFKVLKIVQKNWYNAFTNENSNFYKLLLVNGIFAIEMTVWDTAKFMQGMSYIFHNISARYYYKTLSLFHGHSSSQQKLNTDVSQVYTSQIFTDLKIYYRLINIRLKFLRVQSEKVSNIKNPLMQVVQYLYHFTDIQGNQAILITREQVKVSLTSDHNYLLRNVVVKPTRETAVCNIRPSAFYSIIADETRTNTV